MKFINTLSDFTWRSNHFLDTSSIVAKIATAPGATLGKFPSQENYIVTNGYGPPFGMGPKIALDMVCLWSLNGTSEIGLHTFGLKIHSPLQVAGIGKSICWFVTYVNANYMVLSDYDKLWKLSGKIPGDQYELIIPGLFSVKMIPLAFNGDLTITVTIKDIRPKLK
jgi:hypothetical protein